MLSFGSILSNFLHVSGFNLLALFGTVWSLPLFRMINYLRLRYDSDLLLGSLGKCISEQTSPVL
jgi:hypothetical protein